MEGFTAGSEIGPLVIPGRRPLIRFIVVQPTPFCNISCSYCYLPSKHVTGLMSLDTFAKCVSKVLHSEYVGQNIEIIWHAGEPLAVPLEFYNEAVGIVKDITPAHVTVNFALQTNGTLLTEAWAEFFLRNNFDVGLSIDGPQEIHDRYRRTRSGRGTFDKAMAGLEVARRVGLDPSIISVLTLEALDNPEQMFDFYHSNAIRRVGFSVLEQDGVCVNPLLKSRVYHQKYQLFMTKFWNLCLESPATWAIREFDAAVRSLLWPSKTAIPNYQTTPLGFTGIDWEGNCFSYSPEFIGLKNDRLEFKLGNLLVADLNDMLASDTHRRLADEIACGVSLCEKDCEYFSVCGGGSPANKFGELGRMDVTETSFCQLTKKFVFDMMLASLE